MVNTFRPNVPAYKVDVDVAKVQTLGIPVTDAYDALQTFLGGLYVNDFNAFGRTWQVVVQAEPEFRTPAGRHQPLLRPQRRAATWSRSARLRRVSATVGPDVIYRYNRFRAIQLLGGPAAGYSSGQAVDDDGEAGRLGAAGRVQL